MERIKTILLMVGLMFLFMYIGDLVAGETGKVVAFLIACVINFFGYFFSDKIVLKRYNAKEANVITAPVLHKVVKRLALKADLPMPKVYVIPDEIPNAFATGRNPNNAAVAATQGLLDMMNEEEIEGVMAHEMTHVKNYDILTGTIAATLVGAINILSRSAGRRNSGRNVNVAGRATAFAVVLVPLAAVLIRFLISRTREYAADEGAARLTKHPEWLISALQKLEKSSAKGVIKKATPQTAHMFIINPFGMLKSNFSSLFSTHPTTKNRIERLEKLKHTLR